MLYYFNYYIEEGIVPANLLRSQTILVKPSRDKVSVQTMRYLCDTRDCEQYIIT